MFTHESLPLRITLFDYNLSRAIEQIAVSSDGVAAVISKLQLSFDMTAGPGPGLIRPGPDKITLKLLKLCKEIVFILWAELFQQSLDTGIILTDWRTANAIPV